MQWDNNDNFQIENKLMWQVSNCFKTATFETVIFSVSNIRNQVGSKAYGEYVLQKTMRCVWKEKVITEKHICELWLHPFCFFSPQRASLTSLISVYQSIFKILLGEKEKKEFSWLLVLESLTPVSSSWRVKDLSTKNMNASSLKEQWSVGTFYCCSAGREHWRQRKSSGDKGKKKMERKSYMRW